MAREPASGPKARSQPGAKGGKGGKGGKRRGAMGNLKNPGPVTGLIDRAIRMIGVAEPWERFALASAPIWFILTALQGHFGIPGQFRGWGLLLLTCYVGFHFVLWVFLDRRLDEQSWLRFKSTALSGIQEREARITLRRQANKLNAEAKERNEEALRRGQNKAKQPPADFSMADRLNPEKP